MSTKHESAELILKLYDLRREETMRKARDWYIAQFNPESLEDIFDAAMGEHSAYYRMVTTYWEMAASFVHHGAIDEEMFNDANQEHVAVFSKIEPFLAEIRATYNSPQYLERLEKLVMSRPDAKELVAAVRERLKGYAARRAELAARQQQQKAQAGAATGGD